MEFLLEISLHPHTNRTREHPEKWRTNIWFFFLHDNAPAHQSDLAKYLLVKNNVTALELLHYSPDRLQLIFTCSLD
jgi:hypothetical protein